MERTEKAACERHGPFDQRIVAFAGREHRGMCPECSREESERRAKEEAEEQKLARVRWFRTESGVPEICWHANMSRAPEAASQWFANLLTGKTEGPLVIVGDVGTGKSTLAAGMVREVALAGKQALYVSALVYCRKIRDTWGRNAEPREDQILERYARCNFLVLDEIGAGKQADEPIIQELICARYDANLMRRTVIVSNVAPKNLAEKVGARADDRIRDRATLVMMTGASLRRPAA